jgi:hypothetical protein
LKKNPNRSYMLSKPGKHFDVRTICGQKLQKAAIEDRKMNDALDVDASNTFQTISQMCFDVMVC